MQHDLLSRSQLRGGQMSIDIATEKKRLEEQQACCPYAGSPAKPGENIFSDERLNREKEKSASEEGERERTHAG